MVLAHLEAKSISADFPILLNYAGKVAEAAGACLMLVRNNTIVTPPTTSSILESLTRDTLIMLASDLALTPKSERLIERSYTFLTNLLCGSCRDYSHNTN